MVQNDVLRKYCLRLGDNALIHSFKLSEWCGKAPLLEEDLALTNFALDMTGRAELLLEYAGALGMSQWSADDLAYRRGERQYLHCLITELPDADFAYVIAKLFFVSTFESFLFGGLMKSPDAVLAAIAAKTIKEVKYHREHASDWVMRLGLGTEEGYRRLQAAVDSLWMYTGELFETDEVEGSLIAEGIISDSKAFKDSWLEMVRGTLSEAGIKAPASDYMQTGGREGVHTEYLGHILSEMQYLQRAYPDATW